jgi:hypothetical protein
VASTAKGKDSGVRFKGVVSAGTLCEMWRKSFLESVLAF